ncbi:hypothetical protein P152DRAFT_454730 [Eremomyces bilateralis CBS 781.70]|uniref:Uncharacterized protein n=1 Tax=Eremomyces bilateralis CBS 781.70 TaxID=1392243 RepID=A0A6G1GEE9_9PEZI|nr:uncharacterized protein P152DRAFT_454730 [Eremomyces bilateralis CBS 781.70]KAF1816467.1 hypothetical protein P152DRAFT_454730 [Eremomyces bilateralis CBS 781.70]
MAPIDGDTPFPVIPHNIGKGTVQDIKDWGLEAVAILATVFVLILVLVGALKLRNWGKWRIARPVDASKPYREQHWVQTWHGWVLAESKSGRERLPWKDALDAICRRIRYTVLRRPDPLNDDRRFESVMADPDIFSLDQILPALGFDRTIRPSWLAAEMRGWDPLPDTHAESVRIAVSIDGETVEDRTLVIVKRRNPAGHRYRLDGTYDEDFRSWTRSVSSGVAQNTADQAKGGLLDYDPPSGIADHASRERQPSRIPGFRAARKLRAEHKKRAASDQYAYSQFGAVGMVPEAHRCTSLTMGFPQRVPPIHDHSPGNRRTRTPRSKESAKGKVGKKGRVRRSRARPRSRSTQCTASSRTASDVLFPQPTHHPSGRGACPPSRPESPELYLDGAAQRSPMARASSCTVMSPLRSMAPMLARAAIRADGNLTGAVPGSGGHGVLEGQRTTSTSLAETWYTAQSSLARALVILSNHSEDSWMMHGALPWSEGGQNGSSGRLSASDEGESEDPGTCRTTGAPSDTSERTIIRTADRAMSLHSLTERGRMYGGLDGLVPSAGHVALEGSSLVCRSGNDGLDELQGDPARWDTASDMAVETTRAERIKRSDSQKKKIAELWRRRTIHIDKVQRKRNMGYARFAGFDI